MSTASDTYRKATNEAQGLRGEYFNMQLPRILRALKECADEIDLGTQYHLNRYAFLYESVMLADGGALVPSTGEEGMRFCTLKRADVLIGLGLRSALESIDNRGDFKNYMQNYAVAHAGQG